MAILDYVGGADNRPRQAISFAAQSVPLVDNTERARRIFRTPYLLIRMVASPNRALDTGLRPGAFPTKPPACYRASWQLPGPDSHRLATRASDEVMTVEQSPPDHCAHRLRSSPVGQRILRLQAPITQSRQCGNPAVRSAEAATSRGATSWRGQPRRGSSSATARGISRSRCPRFSPPTCSPGRCARPRDRPRSTCPPAPGAAGCSVWISAGTRRWGCFARPRCSPASPRWQ